MTNFVVINNNVHFDGYQLRLLNQKRSFHSHVWYVNAEQWSAMYDRQLLGLFSSAGSLNNDLQATSSIRLGQTTCSYTEHNATPSAQVLSYSYKQYYLYHTKLWNLQLFASFLFYKENRAKWATSENLIQIVIGVLIYINRYMSAYVSRVVFSFPLSRISHPQQKKGIPQRAPFHQQTGQKSKSATSEMLHFEHT
jgi:hypothetical protein